MLSRRVCQGDRRAEILHRKQWAEYFEAQGVQYAFFSAANAAALQAARQEAEAAAARAEEAAAEAAAKVARDEESSSEEESDGDSDNGPFTDEEPSDDDSDIGTFHPVEEGPEAQDPRTRVLSVLELEELFVKSAPDLSSASINATFLL